MLIPNYPMVINSLFKCSTEKVDNNNPTGAERNVKERAGKQGRRGGHVGRKLVEDGPGSFCNARSKGISPRFCFKFDRFCGWDVEYFTCWMVERIVKGAEENEDNEGVGGNLK